MSFKTTCFQTGLFNYKVIKKIIVQNYSDLKKCAAIMRTFCLT